MLNKKMKRACLILSCITMGCSIAGCQSNNDSTSGNAASVISSSSNTSGASSGVTATSLSASDLFSDRDLEQTADLTGATTLTLTSGNDVTISDEGVYILSGLVTDVTIIVEAPDDAKVQLVLDGVSIINDDSPAIYVKNADKVFVTTTGDSNTLKVTGTFTADGDTNLDAVIFSKSDLVLNGTGSLDVISVSGNSITSKDDLKVTGGTYNITSYLDGLEANDSIVICDGSFTITSDKDALHSENEDDLSLGYIYISGGTLNITAKDDAVHGTSLVQIDGGTINITSCVEGIEGTYIQINNGTINIYATDDGINASQKSSSYSVVIEINGGNITIKMGAGDTDAIDANGDIYVNDGIINITAQTSSFDFDGTGEINGGTVTVNGSVITTMPTQMMGGGGMGGGQMGGGKRN